MMDREDCERLLGNCAQELYTMEQLRDELRNKCEHQEDLILELQKENERLQGMVGRLTVELEEEKHQHRVNQIKSRCGDCLHWISIADVCDVSGEERVESDYCSWWEGKQ